MKLHVSVIIVLSLLGATLSSSLERHLRGTYQTAYDDSGTERDRRNANAQGHTTEDVYQPGYSHAQYRPSDSTDKQDDNMPELDSAEFEANKGNSLSQYIMEIQNDVQTHRDDEGLEIQSYLNCIISHSKPDVLHGAKIALQILSFKLEWLGCAGNPCVKATCPHLYMDGDDWEKCGGEISQIYRAAGPGNVKVGDTVGLYFGGQWFSMHKGQGHKDGCPGAPTTKYGFATRDKWYQCFGEVFQIYAKGKSIGDTIQNHDNIALYYVKERKWVGLGGADHPVLRTCPGDARPPPPDRYDKCGWEVFELWLR